SHHPVGRASRCRAQESIPALPGTDGCAQARGEGKSLRFYTPHVVWEEEGGRGAVHGFAPDISNETIHGRRHSRGGVSQTKEQEPASAVRRSLHGRLDPLGGRRPKGGPRAFREGGRHQVP